MKKSDAQINLTIDVECPYCEEYINLLDHSYFTDDGWIYNISMPNDSSWGLKKFNEEWECPNCHKEFIIKNINY